MIVGTMKYIKLASGMIFGSVCSCWDDTKTAGVCVTLEQCTSDWETL